jgi:hypothetical protein
MGLWGNRCKFSRNLPLGLITGFGVLAFAGTACTLSFKNPVIDISSILELTSSLERSVSQPDIVSGGGVDFTVTFSHDIAPASFTGSDLQQTGTATVGSWTISPVSNSVFTATANSPSDGTLIPKLPAGAVTDIFGHTNSTDSTSITLVTVDSTAPTISSWSMTPANGRSSSNNTPVFGGTPNVTGNLTLFDSADTTCATPLTAVTPVTASTPFSGLALSSALVGDGAKTFRYRLAMTGAPFTVTCSLAGLSYTLDTIAPTVGGSAPSLASANSASTVTYTVTYSGATTINLTSANVTLNTTGSATCSRAVTNGTTATPTVTLTSCTGNGTVGITIAAGTASDLAGNSNLASSASTTFVVDNTGPTVTINQAGGQADPAGVFPILFTLVFNEPINPASFITTDINQGGTATGITWGLSTSDNITWTLSASAGSTGTYIPSLPVGRVTDALGNTSSASTTTDSSVTYTPVLAVTINQAGAQADPATAFPILFDIAFSMPITPASFTLADLDQKGTASGLVWALSTSDNQNYTLTVSSAASQGTIIPALPASRVGAPGPIPNQAATSTDATVTYQNPSLAGDHLEIISGNNQTAQVNQVLGAPVVARVVNAVGAPVAGVTVAFNVELGDGIVSAGRAVSDAGGLVQTNWQMGPSQKYQKLAVTRVGGVLPDVAASGNRVLNFQAIATTAVASIPAQNVLIDSEDSPTWWVSDAAGALINNDAHMDWVGCSSGGIDIRYGNSTGYFSGGFQITADGACGKIVVADVNADGLNDLVVKTTSEQTASNSMRVYLRLAGGGLSAPIALTVSNIYDFRVAEVTGDAQVDIVGVRGPTGGTNVYVYPGAGTGSFGAFTTIAVGLQAERLDVADLTGDGCRDIVVSNRTASPQVRVHTSNCAGVYAQSTTLTSTQAVYPKIAEFTGDVHMDIYVGDLTSGNYAIFPGNSTGTFGAALTGSSMQMPSSISYADFTGDGRMDVVHSGSQNAFGINNGSGVINNVGYAGGKRGGDYTRFTDFNNDGLLDLIVISNIYGAQLLLNQTAGTRFVAPGAAYIAGTGNYTNPSALITRDVNGDQLPDLITFESTNRFLIRNNLGSGTFAAPFQVGASSSASVEAADLDGDGDLDLIDAQSNNVRAYLNSGTGTFGAAVTSAIPFHATAEVKVADMNYDGIPDAILYAWNGTEAYMKICGGIGNGSFGACYTRLVTNAAFAELAIADINLDKALDLYLVQNGSSTSTILLGTGDGDFQTNASGSLGVSGGALNILPITNDWTPDLFFRGRYATGPGNGTFPVPVNATGGSYSRELRLADMNGDGNVDFIGMSDGEILVSTGNGAGVFTDQVFLSNPEYTQGLELADMDGDGKIDIVSGASPMGGGLMLYYGL